MNDLSKLAVEQAKSTYANLAANPLATPMERQMAEALMTAANLIYEMREIIDLKDDEIERLREALFKG